MTSARRRAIPGPPFVVPSAVRFVRATYRHGEVTASLWLDREDGTCAPEVKVDAPGPGGSEAECRAWLARRLRQLAREAEAMAREIEGAR